MLDRRILEAVGGWKGYRVDRIEWPDSQSRTLSVHWKVTAKVMQCDAGCEQVREAAVRHVRCMRACRYSSRSRISMN